LIKPAKKFTDFVKKNQYKNTIKNIVNIGLAIFLIFVLIEINFKNCYAQEIIVEDIEFDENLGDDIELKIKLSQKTNFKIYTLKNPYRLVIDLENAKLISDNYQPKMGYFVNDFKINYRDIYLRLEFFLQKKITISKSFYDAKSQKIISKITSKNADLSAFIDKVIIEKNSQENSQKNSLENLISNNPNNENPLAKNLDKSKNSPQKNLHLADKIPNDNSSLINNNIASIDIKPDKKNNKNNKNTENNSTKNSHNIKEDSDNLTNNLDKKNRESKAITDIKIPVIVIDAGHGGKDPGTIGNYLRSKEKNITLSYARELYKQLKTTKSYKVYLTRNSDIFINLKRRVELARKKNADLFISMHVNAIGDDEITGFSIYTLSEQSSDKQAELLARKENQADIINGVNFSGASIDIMKTLIDLSQRNSKNHSAIFANQVIKNVKNSNIEILQNTHRFAGFAVLTAPDMASVLVELGYLSNQDEEKLLNNLNYKRKVCESLVKAVEEYFSKIKT
jgi:N-acetylmuramoyl-L-alanine amidase